MSAQIITPPRWEYWLEADIPQSELTDKLYLCGLNMWEAVSVDITNHGLSSAFPNRYYTILFKRFIEAEYQE